MKLWPAPMAAAFFWASATSPSSLPSNLWAGARQANMPRLLP